MSALGGFLEVFDLLFGFVSRNTVGLLNFARQLVSSSGNLVKPIIGQLAPLFFHFSLKFLLVTFNDVFVHLSSPSLYRQLMDSLYRRPRGAKLQDATGHNVLYLSLLFFFLFRVTIDIFQHRSRLFFMLL